MAELIRERKRRKYYASEKKGVIAVADEQEGGNGRLTTKISEYWSNLIDNDSLTYALTATKSTDNSQMDTEFQAKEYDGLCTLMMALDMIPIECIVRAYLTGSILEAYLSGQREFGNVTLPDGLEPQDELPELVFTPAKITSCGHELISLSEMAEIIEDSGHAGTSNPLTLAMILRQTSLDVFRFCTDVALDHGIIIADASFEFGFTETESVADRHHLIYLADNILTPESSCLWESRRYDFHSGPMSRIESAQEYSMLCVPA